MEKKQYTYDYPHPAVTTDCVIFGYDGKHIHILLIERGIKPFKGSWALPGGFLKMDETVEEGAARELFEETQVKDVYLKQFKVYSAVNRDPRERVLTVAFMALVRKKNYKAIAGDDAARAKWFDMDELPPLAFDHAEILADAKEHLKEQLKVSPIAFRLLDEKFTIGDLQRVYELINGRVYDRRNFHRKALASGLLTNESDSDETVCCRLSNDQLNAQFIHKATVNKSCLEKTPRQVFRFNQEAFEKQTDLDSKRNPFDF